MLRQANIAAFVDKGHGVGGGAGRCPSLVTPKSCRVQLRLCPRILVHAVIVPTGYKPYTGYAVLYPQSWIWSRRKQLL